jgi:hypothetical protein
MLSKSKVPLACCYRSFSNRSLVTCHALYVLTVPSVSIYHRQSIALWRACDVSRSHMWRAVPWLRRLVTDLSPLSPGFAAGSIHVEFVVDKVALGQVFPLSVSHHRRSPYAYIIWRMNNMSVSGSSSETYSPHNINQSHIWKVHF